MDKDIKGNYLPGGLMVTINYLQMKVDIARSLEEMLSYDDEAFLVCVYITLLGRNPDPQGFMYYFDKIKAGEGKIEIIYQIYRSREARKRSVYLSGLKLAMEKMYWARIPLINKLFKKNNKRVVETKSDSFALKAVIVNFTGDRSNWGCQATSWELVKFIHQTFGDRLVVPFDFIPLFPRAQIDLQIDSRLGVEIETALAASHPTETELLLLLNVAEQRYGHYLEKIRNSDVVFFQAEGTLTGSDMIHGWRLLLLPYIAKRIFGKTVLSLNQTFFWKNPRLDDFVLNVLDSFDLVAVREPVSLEYLQSNGFFKACLIPDVAFLAPAVLSGEGLPRLEPNKHYFGVTGSAILQFFSIDSIILLVEEIRDRFGIVPVFICSAGSDLELVSRVQMHWGEGVLSLAPSSNYRAVAAIIQQCDFLFGGRYHMAILAATVKTPFVLLPSNTPKNEGLLALLDYPLNVRHIEDASGILEDVQRILGSPDFYKDVLNKGMLKVLSLIDSGKTIIRSALEKERAYWNCANKMKPQHLQQVSSTSGCHVTEEAFDFYRSMILRQAQCYSYPDDLLASFPSPPQLLNIILPLIVNLRRGIEVEESMVLLRHAVEGYIDDVCIQLDTRWLVSICDTYAEFGTPIECRNAFMISMLAIFEKTSQTYAYWRLGYPQTLDSIEPLEHRKIPLWDGMDSFHLVHGDVTINLFRRFESLLVETPNIEKIYKRVKDAIEKNETILGTLNKHHKHVFETDYSWILDDEYAELRKSGEIPLSKYQQFIK
jgi:hypothetical protein